MEARIRAGEVFYVEGPARIRVLDGRVTSLGAEVGELEVPPTKSIPLRALDESLVEVLEGVDTGKSGLTTYLMNRLLGEGFRVGVIDTDIGQSDIGPPTTMGLALPDREYPLLTMLRPQALYFVGLTSPRLLRRVSRSSS